MIRSLLRADPAIYPLPLGLLMGGVLSSGVALPVLYRQPFSDADIVSRGLLALAVLLGAMFSGFMYYCSRSFIPNLNQRYVGIHLTEELSAPVHLTEFELSLPVSGRSLVCIRIASVILTLWISIALISLTGIAVIGQPGMVQVVAGVFATIAAGIPMVVICLHLPSPDRTSAGQFYGRLIAGFFTLLAGAMVPSMWIALVLGAGSVLAGLILWRTLPETIGLVTEEAGRDSTTEGVGRGRATEGAGRDSRICRQAAIRSERKHALHRWLFKESLASLKSWGIAMGFFLFGFLARSIGDWPVVFPGAIIALGLFFSGAALNLLQALRHIDHLPASRRIIFPYVALPAMVWLFLGYIGAAVSVLGDRSVLRGPQEPIVVALGLIWFLLLYSLLRPTWSASSLAEWRPRVFVRVGIGGLFIAWLFLAIKAPQAVVPWLRSLWVAWVGLVIKLFPANPLLSWCLIAVILASFYLVLQRRFMQTEVPWWYPWV